jgi:hypothetical protein
LERVNTPGGIYYAREIGRRKGIGEGGRERQLRPGTRGFSLQPRLATASSAPCGIADEDEDEDDDEDEAQRRGETDDENDDEKESWHHCSYSFSPWFSLSSSPVSSS